MAGLIKALGHEEDRSVRKAAADALAQVGDLRAVVPLMAALRDTDAGVREAAAKALGQCGDFRAVVICWC